MPGKQWVKGQSGNPKGRPRFKLFDDLLKADLSANKSRKAKALSQKLIELAQAGDVQAMRLIADRVGGKPRPAESAPPPETQLTREQIRQRLAELLMQPEMKSSVQAILAGEDGPVQ
jgi:hypothetical protein